EHNPDEIWNSVQTTIPVALVTAGVTTNQVAAIGVTNQRETVVVWERATGKPLARAIVWQDRRTAAFCKERQADQPWLTERTGLVLDPYFSATKLRWLFAQNPDWRTRAGVAGGNIDSFLIFRLTGGTT